MKRTVLLLCAIAIAVPAFLHSQEGGNQEQAQIETGEKKHDQKASSGAAEKKNNRKTSNFNVDAMVLYGQYNRMLWLGSLTQSFDAFTYQLNSQFNRSNDFGYRNSGYYDNEIGFTGEADITEKWKMTPEVEVKNESHGMFSNPFYSREEKDRVVLKIKNDFKPMPTRWNLNIGGAYFTHRLDSTQVPDIFTLKPYHSTDFYKINTEFGWQYIWSAANRLAFNSKFSHYFYKAPYDYDSWVVNEFTWNFNLSEYFKFGIGPQYTYNHDRGHFISGRIEASTAKVRYFSAGASYVYELVPFTPEDFYYNKRYVKPAYNLLPGKGHHAELNLGIDVSTSSDKPFYVKTFRIKATGSFVTNDRYYAYFSLPELVLSTHRMKIEQAAARCETAIGFAIYSSSLEMGGTYEYTYSYASDYVTYQPVHQGNGFIRLTVYRLETEFSTGYRGRMHASPFCRMEMSPALTGSLYLQVRVLDSFFLFGRIDNIYNARYSTVYVYPEQGRSVIGGLRIII